MTRLNLVDPSELMDQHLFAEFREIKMVPKSLRRSLAAASRHAYDPEAWVRSRVPAQFTLTAGHVSFFYDKGAYLVHRYAALRDELARRGYAFDRDASLDASNVFGGLGSSFQQDYRPTPEALALVRMRIAERIALKPLWYRRTPSHLEAA
jgi:deoxyribonuclease (pyrimidine dimer)